VSDLGQAVRQMLCKRGYSAPAGFRWILSRNYADSHIFPDFEVLTILQGAPKADLKLFSINEISHVTIDNRSLVRSRYLQGPVKVPAVGRVLLSRFLRVKGTSFN
jgi:hypothetical protein